MSKGASLLKKRADALKSKLDRFANTKAAKEATGRAQDARKALQKERRLTPEKMARRITI